MIDDLIQLGKNEFKHQAYNSAVASFKKVISEDPNNKTAWLYIIKCQIELKKYSEAEGFLKMLLGIAPDFFEAKELLKELEVKKESYGKINYDFFEAKEHLKKLVNNDFLTAKERLKKLKVKKESYRKQVQLQLIELKKMQISKTFFKYKIIDNYTLKTEPDSGAVFLFYYHPYRRGNNPEFDEISEKILKFKEDDSEVVYEYFKILNLFLKENITLCCVPSHDENKKDGSLCSLINKLTEKDIRTNAGKCLVRIKTIGKLSHGNPRDIKIHLESIKVQNVDLIKNQEVLIIDDVLTTGNSLKACKILLLDAGARDVGCFTLSHTVNKKESN